MRKETRILVRDMAMATKTHMELLIKALNTAEALNDENNHQRNTINTYCDELSLAKDRHAEDEATIQIKDSQIQDAKREINSCKEGWSNQKLMLDEKDETINNLKNEVRKLQNELGVTEDEPV